MYKTLEKNIYEEISSFTFYESKILSRNSEECHFCLTVQNRDCGTDEEILLDFIYDYDEFEQKAQTAVREFMLGVVASNVDCVAYDLGLENLKIIAGEFGIATTAGADEKYFQLNDNNDYEKLENDMVDYIKTLSTNMHTNH